MERFNGEVRDREKVIRGLKKDDTPILKGYQIFHNYIRPHEGLDGKTPAEACGIEVKGNNKWMTLIQTLLDIDDRRIVGVDFDGCVFLVFKLFRISYHNSRPQENVNCHKPT